jgi:meso-butanediol dehydrogenase / (S,S)-butanediol dehydrogenase / diacetyl reductase
MAELLAGRKALVTGAGAGIGRAIALALAREGARVVVTDLDGEAADQVAGEIGPETLSFALDVTRATEVEEVMNRARSRMRGLDILCANAGVSTMNPVRDLSEEEWDYNMAVNAKGVFLTNQAAIRLWEPVGTRGVIVNTASLAAKQGAPLLAHYSASKFAVLGFTQALAREVAPLGIRVNCVCPGFVRSSMQERELVWEAGLRRMTVDQVRDEYMSLIPLGRIEEPEDVADTVVFLCSDLARFITGEALNVTGGVRMD